MASVSGAPPVRDVMIFCVPIFWDAELLRRKMLCCSRIRCPRFWDAELGIAGRRPARDMVPAKQKEMPSAHHMTTRTGGGAETGKPKLNRGFCDGHHLRLRPATVWYVGTWHVISEWHVNREWHVVAVWHLMGECHVMSERHAISA